MHRYLFADWEAEAGTKAKWVWRTMQVHSLSRLSALETLQSHIIGWGCCRLLNVSKKKPAESAAFVMPPAVAVLRKRREGDWHLAVSFHTAVMHQVPRRKTCLFVWS